MNSILLKIMLGLGIFGHFINMYCDYILSVFPNGKLVLVNFNDFYDVDKMRTLMNGVNEKILMRSSIFGTFALVLEALGYFAITMHVYELSHLLGIIMFISIVVFIVVGTAHHVICAISEWVYIKLGRTDEAHKTMVSLYNSAPITKMCYLGYIIFIITLFIAIITGYAGVSLWMLIFTVLPIFLLLAPFRIIGTLHISAMLSMLAWLIVI